MKVRARKSFREAIREAVRHRMERGEPLNVKSIIAAAGGGSNSTVIEEIRLLREEDRRRGEALVDGERVLAAVEYALSECRARQDVLLAENAALRVSLDLARADVEKLLASHQDSQRMLLQGVDDLRQMVKAGQGALPKGILEAEHAKLHPPESGEVTYWRAKHDQLLRRLVDLENKNRLLLGQIHDLGGDGFQGGGGI